MKRFIAIMTIGFICAVTLYFSQDRLALYIQQGIDHSRYTFTPFNNVNSIYITKSKVSFSFDDEKQRQSKSVNGELVEKYHWLGEGRLHLITDKDDNVLREYLYQDEFSELPYAMLTQGKRYQFIYNPIRSLRLVLDESGNIVKQIEYDAKGARTTETNRALVVDYSYAGAILEPITKHLFFVEGVYSPITGKWITRIENDDVIENLKNLNQLNDGEVYQCEDTLDTYYHAYLCVKGQCGGLYATDFLHYFNAKAQVFDNSHYFKPSRCTLITPPPQISKQAFASCVKEKIQPRKAPLFDAIKHNCHHEVEEIVTYCKNHTDKGLL